MPHRLGPFRLAQRRRGSWNPRHDVVFPRLFPTPASPDVTSPLFSAPFVVYFKVSRRRAHPMKSVWSNLKKVWEKKKKEWHWKRTKRRVKAAQEACHAM